MLDTRTALNLTCNESSLIKNSSQSQVYPKTFINIYYGSQTGTAMSFATTLSNEGLKYGFHCEVIDLVDFEKNDVALIQKKNNSPGIAIFIIATYGEGDAPDNASYFCHYLQEKVSLNDKNSEKPFNGLEYSVFGLGDSQYINYNAAAKLVHKHMQLLGAIPITDICLGDDFHDLEFDFHVWKKNLWSLLQNLCLRGECILKKNIQDIKKEIVCQYHIDFIGDNNTSDIHTTDQSISNQIYITADDCPVIFIRELRSSTDSESTLHLEIDISNRPNLTYQTADNLGILPINDEVVVNKLGKALQYNLHVMIKLQWRNKSNEKLPFPTPCTVRDVLRRYCDLTGVVRRKQLKSLALYAKNTMCKNALLRMSNKDGKKEYREKIINARVGIVDIISKLCPSIQIPLGHFIALCPRMLPRYYTISSSSLVFPRTIHITVKVKEDLTINGSRWKGLCSSYLSRIRVGDSVAIFVRKSNFRLPNNPESPIVMIGPGTGIAPMRAFLQERSLMMHKYKVNVGPNILYFGCQYRSRDCLYLKELKTYKLDGTLSELNLAFSREQHQKYYVQHLLSQNKHTIWKLINDQNAYIYLCGSIKMGQDVNSTLKEIISELGELTLDEVKKYKDGMTSCGRFVQELWA